MPCPTTRPTCWPHCRRVRGTDGGRGGTGGRRGAPPLTERNAPHAARARVAPAQEGYARRRPEPAATACGSPRGLNGGASMTVSAAPPWLASLATPPGVYAPQADTLF